MKTIFTSTLTAAALIAGLSGVASAESSHDGSHDPVSGVVAEHMHQVRAGDLFPNKELVRKNLAPDDVIKVTNIHTTGIVDAPSRND